MVVQIKKTYQITLEEDPAVRLMQLLKKNAGVIVGTSLTPLLKELLEAFGEDSSILL